MSNDQEVILGTQPKFRQWFEGALKKIPLNNLLRNPPENFLNKIISDNSFTAENKT